MAHNFAPPAALRTDVTDVDAADIITDIHTPMDMSRKELLHEIAQLEGCLRYMGLAHPQLSATRQRLETVQQMLALMESQAPKGR